MKIRTSIQQEDEVSQEPTAGTALAWRGSRACWQGLPSELGQHRLDIFTDMLHAGPVEWGSHVNQRL